MHDALIELLQEFPAEDGIAELVRGMALIIKMLPKLADSSLTNAEKGDVQLPRLLMRLTKQNGIDTRALDKALHEDGSILSEQAEYRKRNEAQEVDLYVAFAVNPSKASADLVECYLKLELQSKTYGWSAGLEAIRPGSGEYLSADCRFRLGRYLQDEVDSDSCSVGGLILLLVMFLSKDPGSVYDTHFGFECVIQPEGRIRRTDLAIDPSDALGNAPPETVKRASDILELELPDLVRAFIDKHLAECRWGETVGVHLGLSREQFQTEYENKVAK